MNQTNDNAVESASTLKLGAQLCRIREQVLRDPVTGLTLQFEMDERGLTFLRIFGDFKFGNREIIFDEDGKEAGAGTHAGAVCRPTWMSAPEEGT